MSKGTDTNTHKAHEITVNKGVKLHIFYPSATRFWTVVGKDGEYIQFKNSKLCSCARSFFNIIRNNNKTCPHIDALQLSQEQQIFEKIIGDDSELAIFIRLLCP